MFLVDTNVLLDIFSDDPVWRPWSERSIRDSLVSGVVGINPIIYAETSLAFTDPRALDHHLSAFMLVRFQLPYEAGFLAARAFLRYRRAGGARLSPLPDFYIGAHAETQGLTLLTRDMRRYQTYFPAVKLVTPRDLATGAGND